MIEGRRHFVIVGPTAAGKSSIAMELALRPDLLGAETIEIVSIDSMCVYKKMDIGTAKPGVEARKSVKHHMIDVVEPSEDYSVSRFQVDALKAIDEIEAKGSTALLVGGTGLYLRAVIDKLDIPGQWPEMAAELKEQCMLGGAALLHDRLKRLDPIAASRMEPSNERRVIRALEVTIGSGRPFSSFGPGMSEYGTTPFLQVGIDPGIHELDRRIESRMIHQMEQGFLEEVSGLVAESIPVSKTAAQGLGYRELFGYLAGESDLGQAVGEAIRRTRKFARRQRSWFRRDRRIVWADPQSQIDSVVRAFAEQIRQSVP
ncbi:MAG TPA: tRNA (adenosine(37)-N6)-dimethylallyltransferase MiaA [Acidimicrobiales bacterium]|nr:tRNA (adenosine(37)-N6)-dimethylallyltransferase MiaA [Acidimicrobiales bacterium]